ncbi:hypothetical protein LIN78_03655 [Leeia sp. TBRC 13508]|uniref:Uncharacterized protein n=1 Tax=Leeia speluncae TaxID=2884804 RepID=A0ABS8D372_9NEIS|nr:hypothetical protein [Leeia speluncae]MCB6182647.1 hypothetical protein [Leeia speluncae]
MLRIFLDTEFTNFSDPRLISIGLVSEKGDECYLELSEGWSVGQCSAFVREKVLPQLNLPEHRLSIRTARERLRSWLRQFGEAVVVVFDAEEDRYLVEGLLGSHGPDLILQWRKVEPLERQDQEEGHHALEDAKTFKRYTLLHQEMPL